MILVTGATGRVGRELVPALVSAGVPFRALVRDPARAATLPAMIGDLDKPMELDGFSQVFLLTPGTGTSQCAHVVDAAARAGVRHIVLLSSFAVLGDPAPAMGRWHHEREQLIRASGIPATFLRAGGFMTNALEWVPTIRSAGYVLDATGPGRLAPIDPFDIAAVACHLLTSPGHAGKSPGHAGKSPGHAGKSPGQAGQEYVLTGPEALTVAEQVAIIGAATGLSISIRQPASVAEAIRSRYAGDIPQALADAMTEAFELVRADTVGLRTDTVQQLLGRPPRTFADWCARNAEAFTS
jgi:uncharacterized protein YbjT (DUF2867 family)